MIYYNIITTSLERGKDDDDVTDLKTYYFFVGYKCKRILFKETNLFKKKWNYYFTTSSDSVGLTVLVGFSLISV